MIDMIDKPNQPTCIEQRSTAHAWRPVGILVLAIAGMTILLESDALQSAVRAILGGSVQ